MTNLRTLHFQFPRLPMYDGPANHRSLPEVAFEFKRFANAFVEYLDSAGICPRLNAIIIGACWHYDRLKWSEGAGIMVGVPGQCFVKGYQISLLGRRRPIAIPVSTSELRELQPESSVIDLDFENKWIDALPGRFHD